MTTGDQVRWKVVYQKALAEWIDAQKPDEARLNAMEQWLADAEIMGPPSYSFSVGEDFYFVHVPGAATRAHFLAITHDQWMVIREFL